MPPKASQFESSSRCVSFFWEQPPPKAPPGFGIPQPPVRDFTLSTGRSLIRGRSPVVVNEACCVFRLREVLRILLSPPAVPLQPCCAVRPPTTSPYSSHQPTPSTKAKPSSPAKLSAGALQGGKEAGRRCRASGAVAPLRSGIVTAEPVETHERCGVSFLTD